MNELGNGIFNFIKLLGKVLLTLGIQWAVIAILLLVFSQALFPLWDKYYQYVIGAGIGIGIGFWFDSLKDSILTIRNRRKARTTPKFEKIKYEPYRTTEETEQ